MKLTFDYLDLMDEETCSRTLVTCIEHIASMFQG